MDSQNLALNRETFSFLLAGIKNIIKQTKTDSQSKLKIIVSQIQKKVQKLRFLKNINKTNWLKFPFLNNISCSVSIYE